MVDDGDYGTCLAAQSTDYGRYAVCVDYLDTVTCHQEEGFGSGIYSRISWGAICEEVQAAVIHGSETGDDTYGDD